MADNSGFLMLAGLGALLFLGGGIGKQPQQQKPPPTSGSKEPFSTPYMGMAEPLVDDMKTGGGFDIQSYINSLFKPSVPVAGQSRTVGVTPSVPVAGQSRTVVVTSSGVPTTSGTTPTEIASTTQVQVGGAGGETISASSLAVMRETQIRDQQEGFAANVFIPNQATVAAAISAEELRQKKFAADLIAKNIAAQAAQREAVLAKTRAAQEALADKGTAKVVFPPTINFRHVAEDEEGLSFGSTAGQTIILQGYEFDEAEDTVDFTPEASQSFELSAGTDSPQDVYASEDEQPSAFEDYGFGAYYGGAEDE